jgi:hypothetical protein
MKNIIKLATFVLIFANTFAQNSFDKSVGDASLDLANKLLIKNKKKIVVLYITDINKAQTTAGKYIADVISVNIVNNSNNFEVFDRENLSGIAEAKKLIAEGYIDVDKAKELGKLLSVEAIIIGNYTVLSSTLKLTLKALDSNTGLMIAATGKELPIDSDAGALLGINTSTSTTKDYSNRGFNNHPLNSDENYNNPGTVDSECDKQNSGDYCFMNNTQYILVANVGRTEMTLKPGQTQCLYNIPRGPLNYIVYSRDKINNMRNPEYSARGQIYIEKCKSKTFIIK